MVGQDKVKKNLKELINNGKLPRFIIIVGPEGSGKKTLSKWIAKQLNSPCITYDNKTDSVRQVIDLAYKQTSTIFYCIENYQSMNAAAKNALLKVTEEPPNKAYIIMTSTTDADMLDTLKSRSYMITMDSYSEQDIITFCNASQYDTKYARYSVVPGDVVKFSKIDYDKFDTFIDNVWNNITRASMGNVLKLSSFFRIKENEVDNYDIGLFINAMIVRVVDCIKPAPVNALVGMYQCLLALGKAKRDIQRSYAKQPIVDKLLLTLRTNLYGVV